MREGRNGRGQGRLAGGVWGGGGGEPVVLQPLPKRPQTLGDVEVVGAGSKQRRRPGPRARGKQRATGANLSQGGAAGASSWRAPAPVVQSRLSEYFSQSQAKLTPMSAANLSWAATVEEGAFGDDDPAGVFPLGGAASGHGGLTEADEDEVLKMTEEVDDHDAHGATPAPSDE